MSHDLEGLLEGGIGRARQLDGSWDGARAARVRGLALKTHSAQVRRTRAMGRVLVGGTSAACLVLALLRVASSAPTSASASPASPTRRPTPSGWRRAPSTTRATPPTETRSRQRSSDPR
jgi:hypothetical protein